MKSKILILGFFLCPLLLNAQFEQKVSINLSSGIFKTFGKRTGEYDPRQMPNFKTGIAAEGGLQFNINRRFSLVADIGIMYSGGWSYKVDGTEYTHFTIYDMDPEPDVLLAEGYNELRIFNFSITLKPQVYLLPGKKLNPFIYAGLNLNYLHASYEDNWWKAANELNVLEPDDTGPYNPYLEKNFGPGFNPGFGVEYCPNDKIGFSLSAGYYFMILNKNNFKGTDLEENFNAFLLQAGIRFSFIKSKDL